MVKSGITQDELVKWGGKETFNQALALVNSGDVSNVEYDCETLEVTGLISQPSGWEMKTGFHLERDGRIKSKCPCATNQKYSMICEHVVALGIVQMVKEMDENEGERKGGGGDGSGSGSEGQQAYDSKDPDRPCATLKDPEYIEVKAAPRFYIYVSGSRASLSIELNACYGANGEIDFPACSLQAERTVWLEDPNDPLVRRTRSMEREREAVKFVEKCGFEPGYKTGDVRFYLTDPQKVLNFLGAGIPAVRRKGWHVELSEKLGALLDSLPVVAPLVEIRDNDKNFDVKYSFTAFSEKGSVEISPIEVQAAINRGDGYILRDGVPILLDNKAVESMHDIFRDVASAGSGTEDGWFRVKGVHAPYVKSSIEHLGFEYDDNAAANWREIAAERNRENGDAKFEPVPLGELEGVLRPYQKQGVYWMRFLENAGLSGLLADEMGLGKTLQTLAWLSLERVGDSQYSEFPNLQTSNLQPSTSNLQPSTSNPLPSLIICPTSLVRNWEAEAKKFTPWMKTLVISGPERAKDFQRIDKSDLVITSYALLQRDFEEAYLDREFAVVVLDEAQHIKNRRTRNAVAAKGLNARQRLVLTGTPVENSVTDVWSIFDFLMPDYLGDYESFKLNYEMPIGEGGSAADDAQFKLKRKLHPFILRRLKTTVAKDLPDKLVKVSYCPVPDDIQREYNEVLAKERRGAKTKFQMLALLMKLRQIASRGKVDAFMEQLDEAIDGGHRVLVFSQFVKQLTTLRKTLDEAGVKYCYLDGSTKDRLGECNRFNHDQSIPVFLISLMAGGTGLNLTGADMVMHYDPWWNPAVENQATDRAHRIGQKKKVYVVKLIASDTIEEKVLALQRRKEAVIAATVSTSDEAIVERLTTEDLNELLS